MNFLTYFFSLFIRIIFWFFLFKINSFLFQDFLFNFNRKENIFAFSTKISNKLKTVDHIYNTHLLPKFSNQKIWIYKNSFLQFEGKKSSFSFEFLLDRGSVWVLGWSLSLPLSTQCMARAAVCLRLKRARKNKAPRRPEDSIDRRRRCSNSN